VSEGTINDEQAGRALALALIGLAGLGAHTAIALRYRARYRHLLRDGVERCRLRGRDPEQWLLRVIADIQSVQKFPVRGPYHRMEARWVRQELDRVAGRTSADF
jgi:hypothetical protein